MDQQQLAVLRQRYADDGIVQLPGAFDANWVHDLTDAIDRVLAKSLDPALPLLTQG